MLHKRSIKILAVGFAAVMAASMLSACGNDESTTGSDSNQSSISGEKDLASMLTAHKWIYKHNEVTGTGDIFTIEFNNDGTFFETYTANGNHNTDYKGNWEIKEPDAGKQVTPVTTSLELTNTEENHMNEGWKKSDLHRSVYAFLESFTDNDCEKFIKGEIDTHTRYDDIRLDYGFYVSDKYFLFDRLYFAQ